MSYRGLMRNLDDGTRSGNSRRCFFWLNTSLVLVNKETQEKLHTSITNPFQAAKRYCFLSSWSSISTRPFDARHPNFGPRRSVRWMKELMTRDHCIAAFTAGIALVGFYEGIFRGKNRCIWVQLPQAAQCGTRGSRLSLIGEVRV